ncbi:PBP1A family penicillin-binding protein [Olsenella sp. DSM 107455]|uniref:PBP1A family penicillin-binding protein n=1 Tax=Thermophilibacter gallinarum TaxID=2779357 RepID=A0ABR9QRH0_9ACTN|nr:PBP1A family penicillin-binding protein [Thermophilibacter gallinarum]MBE5023649.1 PBP1A family penicillin-binding protein [Thermophilibacter gallinarum]
MGIRTRRARSHSKTHFVGFSLAGALGFIALLCVTLALSLGAVVSTWLEDLPDYTSADAFLVAEPTRVFDADGNEIVAYYLQNRRSVELDQISDYVKKGTIDTEDKRFYQHNGVDPEGIARAAVGQVFGGGEQGGGSTITQQLVRWTVLSDEQFENSLRRKVREAYIAIQMEKTYTKDQILSMYLNTIYYGNGAYGIEAASITYFNKSATDLTLNEAATLVGIPNSPTYYDPFVNYENCKSRRNLVLSRMLEAGDISQEEYDTTVAEEIPLNPGELTDSDSKYPYFTDYVRNLLLQDFSSDTIAQGGLKVYTTLDPDMQKAAEKAVKNRIEAANNDDVNGALVAIDNSNGYIVAMVGGTNYGNDAEAGQSTINLATSRNQTGSSFKAVVLMAALNEGMSPNTKINCPSTIQVTPTWAPSNIYKASYGVITLQRATAVSSNTGYVQVAEAIGMDKVADMAAKLGIDSPIEPGLSSALGTSPISPLEMAEAFSTIANGGVHRNPVAITRIEDRNGNVVYEHEDSSEQVVDSAIAADAIEVLKTVVTQGSATSVRSYFTHDQPIFGKTGTAENWSNLWFCGATPQISCAVWVGNPNASSKSVRYQGAVATTANTAIPIWGNFMDDALEGVERGDFPKSDHKAEYKPNNSWTFLATSKGSNSEKDDEERTEEEAPETNEPTTTTEPETPPEEETPARD